MSKRKRELSEQKILDNIKNEINKLKEILKQEEEFNYRFELNDEELILINEIFKEMKEVEQLMEKEEEMLFRLTNNKRKK